ncbi:carbohydrate ABC transporter permease [Microbacterium pseudoresistens]|uniref:Multiple sugar transport system permease protein n=1 Tax=Microbacterium pseudoresistens TaxID=640634 RepID=A0A7Y9ESH2_9MICO|nr:carbohydrate ABC transporter permease [Microbacterium pseudoresistens]NYD53130.1 multiple sugar transport system permease protein [Microbacterium pseudoresistens]
MAKTDTSLLVTTSPVQRRRPRGRGYKTFRVIMLVLVAVTFLAPILWMLLASFKTNVDIYNPGAAFVFSPTTKNYDTVFGQADYIQFIWNSFFVAAVATVLSLLLAVPAAYSMSRFVMKKSAVLVLLARVIPGVSLLVPWYFVFANMRIVGTYTPLVLSHMFVSLPLILYIMMSFFDSMPEDLEEQAQVDGLTPIGAFLRITLPLSVPGIATSSILSFIFSWNNFMFALVLSGASTKTLPVAIFDFVGYASIDWGGLMAAAVVVTIPIMVIALFTQKYIVSGLTAGATKG